MDRLEISPEHLSALRGSKSAFIRYGEDGAVLHVGEGTQPGWRATGAGTGGAEPG